MVPTLAWVYGGVEDEALEWSLVLEAFCPTDFYLIGDTTWRPRRTASTTVVRTAADIGRDLVVLAPVCGRHLAGTVPLKEHTYREDAVYVFGTDYAQLSVDLLGVEPVEAVYLPVQGDVQLHSYEAALILQYDAVMRNG